MAEQEELRLTVTLADNASAGLAKLNEEIKQLGSGAGQQHIEKFKRETGEITGKVKQMGAEVGEALQGPRHAAQRSGARCSRHRAVRP